jgi:preprotein translocase subunit SecG
MYYLLLAIHILVAVLLGVVVLVQRSKGNGLAGAFGGVGAGEAMFGARGVTTVLHKATIYLAVAFMVTSLTLVVMTTQRSGGNAARPARATGGVVLPVGGADVAAPDAPSTTPTAAATDDIVPTESADDSIVPAANPDESDSTADEQTEGEGSSSTQEEGGR